MPPESLSKMPQSHNQRYVKYTNQINTVSRQDSLAARFWTKVRRTPTCWLWAGCTNPQTGVGQLSGLRVRRPDGRSVTVPLKAHRVSWILVYGPIPAGQSVLHHCDNPRCVRPDHLFLGTHRDNMRDAASKGRLSVPRPSARKLLDPDRADIRRRYATGEANMPQLAREYNVTKGYIWQIVHRRSVEFRKAG